ncbi:T-cell surface glycoprotein CD3 delta chain, partial [Galemys pyrenaicus]
NSFAITVSEIEENVHLSCEKSITLLSGTNLQKVGKDNTSVDLGKRILDPRGKYSCEKDGKTQSLQIYYRMCQNCVELDPGTFSGLMIADVIATLLLALGVYCFAGHETGRLSEAANSQVVMRNDQLYQPLRERNNDQYSSLGENWQRNK